MDAARVAGVATVVVSTTSLVANFIVVPIMLQQLSLGRNSAQLKADQIKALSDRAWAEIINARNDLQPRVARNLQRVATADVRPGFGCAIASCEAGPPGYVGDEGVDGSEGYPGMPGLPGPDAPPTPQGADDEHCFVCPAGAMGIVGSPGRRGGQGDKGDKGNSGIPGVDGWEGPVGDTGVDGAVGTAGTPGRKGTAGKPGTGGVGPVGPKGARGPIGRAGKQGPRGAENVVHGPPGVPGKRGTQGMDGLAGRAGGRGDVGGRGQQGSDANFCPCPGELRYVNRPTEPMAPPAAAPPSLPMAPTSDGFVPPTDNLHRFDLPAQTVAANSDQAPYSADTGGAWPPVAVSARSGDYGWVEEAATGGFYAPDAIGVVDELWSPQADTNRQATDEFRSPDVPLNNHQTDPDWPTAAAPISPDASQYYFGQPVMQQELVPLVLEAGYIPSSDEQAKSRLRFRPQQSSGSPTPPAQKPTERVLPTTTTQSASATEAEASSEYPQASIIPWWFYVTPATSYYEE